MSSIPACDPAVIRAVLFDINGTLRRRVPDEAWQEQGRVRLARLLGEPQLGTGTIEELTRRYKTYTHWADEQGVNLPEAEIWRRWIAPERPPEGITTQAVELTVALRDCRGRTVLKQGAAGVVNELHRRGYRLGVISNSPSTVDIPRFLEDCGLAGHFEAIVLSSLYGVRKPDPSIFHEAALRMQVEPQHCAYVGNKPSCDVAGPRRAGFALTVLVDAKQADARQQPDCSVQALGDLLEIFPPRPVD